MEEVGLEGEEWIYDVKPNECPICHHAIDARYLAGVVRRAEPMGESVVELVFQCPRRDCLRAFIGRYQGFYDRQRNGPLLQLHATTPFSPKAPVHSDEVAAVSAQFVSILSEAATAEHWKLSEVAGCGYRKALEFLVKDYCIRQSPDRADEIRSKFLGAVIADHLDDVNIKQCARRAAWLGNDETHYVREWSDHDIDDLKRLIALTESWITTAERTKQYLAEMEG